MRGKVVLKNVKKLIKRTKKHINTAKVNKIKQNVIGSIKFNRNLVNNFFDYYILNDFLKDEIHNDLGASFTQIKRHKGNIIKIANEQGEDKLRNEIEWYLKFKKSSFSNKFPKIINYSTKPGNVFFEMKYYSYPNLRSIIMKNMNAPKILRKRWSHIINFLNNNFYVKKHSAQVPDDFVQKAHFDKLTRRLVKTLSLEPLFQKLLDSNTIIINNTKYLNVNIIINEIIDDSEVKSRLKPPALYLSHGDIHCNNILCGLLSDNFILLDCRGKSPNGDLYFDMAYDFAKIYHDLRSYYSLIESHNFNIFLDTLSNKSISVDFEFLNPELVKRFDYNKKIVDSLMNRFTKNDSNLMYRIEFTEAMLFLTMIIFHLKSKSEGVACYITGIIRLNEWFKKYYPKKYAELIKVNSGDVIQK